MEQKLAVGFLEEMSCAPLSSRDSCDRGDTGHVGGVSILKVRCLINIVTESGEGREGSCSCEIWKVYEEARRHFGCAAVV